MPRGAHRSELVIGVLGMPDNEATEMLLGSLVREAGLDVDFVVYWTPSARQQWRRLVRKVRRDGIGAALQRIVFAARATKRSAVPARAQGVRARVASITSATTTRASANTCCARKALTS